MFATYGETIEYLDENLPDDVGGRERVVVDRQRDSSPDERHEALARFAPHTVVRPDYDPPDGEVGSAALHGRALRGPEPPAGAGRRSRTTCPGTRSGSCSETGA